MRHPDIAFRTGKPGHPFMDCAPDFMLYNSLFRFGFLEFYGIAVRLPLRNAECKLLPDFPEIICIDNVQNAHMQAFCQKIVPRFPVRRKNDDPHPVIHGTQHFKRR